jgi:hypothetical protein
MTIQKSIRLKGPFLWIVRQMCACVKCFEGPLPMQAFWGLYISVDFVSESKHIESIAYIGYDCDKQNIPISNHVCIFECHSNS